MDECVTLDTEVLTTSGWKTVDKVDVGDSILEWDMETQQTSFKPINKIVDVERSETYVFNSTGFNQHVSGGHRMIIEKDDKIIESTGETLDTSGEFNFITSGVKEGDSTVLSQEIKNMIKKSKENNESLDWVYSILPTMSSEQASEFLKYYSEV